MKNKKVKQRPKRTCIYRREKSDEITRWRELESARNANKRKSSYYFSKVSVESYSCIRTKRQLLGDRVNLQCAR